jgi:hypothetical protein
MTFSGSFSGLAAYNAGKAAGGFDDSKLDIKSPIAGTLTDSSSTYTLSIGILYDGVEKKTINKTFSAIAAYNRGWNTCRDTATAHTNLLSGYSRNTGITLYYYDSTTKQYKVAISPSTVWYTGGKVSTYYSLPGPRN